MALNMWKRADIQDLDAEDQQKKTNFGSAMGDIVNSIKPMAFYKDTWFWLFIASLLVLLFSIALNIYQKLENAHFSRLDCGLFDPYCVYGANRLRYELKVMRGTEDVEEETKHEEHNGKDHWSKTTRRLKKSVTQVAGSLSVTVEKETPATYNGPSTSSCQEISE
ncbi:hypothetical protein WR25_21216 [Diploscapter pachys]|uniref:Uncharacterized protein n=1 Tax=Diploscapter pachys TaxID=2018661 RepID=A0A2A2KXX8_9BILA|nr:hypothetical protein WR25_21216 [Diploscapter pachys]